MGNPGLFLAIFCTFLVNGSGLGQVLLREYRFSPNQQHLILDEHNQLRASEPASNMQEMVWDPKLEELALDWVRRCDAWHRPANQRRGAGGYNYAGENIWWSNERYLRRNLRSVIRAFYAEKPWFDHSTATCNTGKVCGHYLTLVWAETCAVGCAASYCSGIKNNRGIPLGHIILCNYGPGGNRRGIQPYRMGPRCGSCPHSCTPMGLCQSTCPRRNPFSSWIKNYPQIPSDPDFSNQNYNWWGDSGFDPVEHSGPYFEPLETRVYATDASGRLRPLKVPAGPIKSSRTLEPLKSGNSDGQRHQPSRIVEPPPKSRNNIRQRSQNIRLPQPLRQPISIATRHPVPPTPSPAGLREVPGPPPRYTNPGRLSPSPRPVKPNPRSPNSSPPGLDPARVQPGAPPEPRTETTDEIVDEECQNRHSLCPFWARLNECQKNADWMQENCYHSCNGHRCGSDADATIVHTTGSCADGSQKCQFWAGTGECEQNPLFMNWKCEASCNRCGPSAAA